MSQRDTMLYWLGQAAKRERTRRGLKPMHVALQLGVDQSSIYRFEKASVWPRNTDALINAYAAALDIPAQRIWNSALRMWRANGR